MPDGIEVSNAASADGADAGDSKAVNFKPGKAVEQHGDNSGPPATVDPGAKREAKAPPRKFKAKVNGQEVEFDEDEVKEAGLTAAQIRRAANERFETARKLEAESKARWEKFEKDPIAFYREKFGPQKAWEMFEQYGISEIAKQQMSEEQKAALAAQEEAAALKAKLEAIEKEKAQAKAQAEQQMWAQRFNQEFTAALKEKGLPPTNYTVRRMSDLTVKNYQDNLGLSPKQIAQIVHEDVCSEVTVTLSQLSGQDILRLIGPDTRKKIREAELAALKGSTTSTEAPRSNGATSSMQATVRRRAEPNPHLLSSEEWRAKYGGD